MSNLLHALQQLGESLWSLLGALQGVLIPWLPLLAWIAFWLFAVNWQALRLIFARGGWVGVVLLGVVAVLVWGVISPRLQPADVFGLKVSNFVEKTVYVSVLVCIMFFCGSLQLSGFCRGYCQFDELAPPGEHGHGDHGHGNSGHDAHGPADHGHAPAVAVHVPGGHH